MSLCTRSLLSLVVPLIWGLIVSVQAPLVRAQVGGEGDQPDFNKEKRFFDVYSRFNQEPTSEETWSGALAGKAQGYQVQTGDTLWGVSETLFGDPQFWPKIWSINSENIENPHQIKIDQEVMFVPGTLGEAPRIGVSESVEQEGEVATSEAPPDPLAAVPLPEPQKKSVSVAGIPGSLPRWGYRKDRRQEIQMEVQKLDRNFKAPNEMLTYFIADKEVQAAGSIAETEMNLSSAAEFQYVFVKLPSAPAEKNFHIVKELGSLKDPFSGEKGVVVRIQGQIEVHEAVNAEQGLYRALVKKTLEPVEVGAQLIPGDLPVYSTQEEGTGESVLAQVIGGQYLLKRDLFGPSNLIFLGGKGLSLGQTYPLYKTQKLRNEKTEGNQSPRVIGKVKIVKLGENFATGVVLSATEDIQVGDTTAPQVK